VADNRVYLRCRACGDTTYLAKYSGQGWWHPDPARLGPDLNQWFDQHEEHCLPLLGVRGDWLELAYEDAERPEERLEYRPKDGWPNDDDQNEEPDRGQ
jgi:hypothetical protein